MSEIEELKEQVALLRAEVAALRREQWSGEPRLGPRQETQADVDARTARLVEAVEKAKAETQEPPPPVDRSNLCTTDGRPVADARASQTNETGQHPSYIVLCDAERAKGFVRPYRDRYKHTTCGGVTTMCRALSETYARDPNFYSHTFCVQCNKHLPVSEFIWTADNQQVGR